tara:strand:+ start:23 stop:340 length:318 start_codon:yes stop_codon:yes gene_type:complete
MNYLAKNLNNSLILPSDVMRVIYKYADPLIAVRQQIENKSYELHKSDTYHNQDILGIPTHYSIDHKKYLMIYYLREANIYKYNVYKSPNFNKYKMKSVYKKWLLL